MKTNIFILLLLFLFSAVGYAQRCEALPSKINGLYSPEDIELVESIVMSSGYDKIRPGLKIKFLRTHTQTNQPSPLLKDGTLPENITPDYIKEHGIPCIQLNNLTLVITGLDSVIYNENKCLPFFKADGDDGNTYRYFFLNRKSVAELTLNDIKGAYMPDEFQAIADRLVGKTIYGKDQIWLATLGGIQIGLKYHPLKVTAITSGGLRSGFGSFGEGIDIRFKPEGYDTEYVIYLQSVPYSFYKRLTFSNPRELYKDIPEKDWDDIKKGEPVIGMSKAYIELALGRPDTKTKHQGAKSIYEIWNYEKVNRTERYHILFENNKVVKYSTDPHSLYSIIL